MALDKSKTYTPAIQAPGYAEFAEVIDAIDATKILRKLNEYRMGGGPRKYQPVSFWRAYLLSYLLNLNSTCDLHRELERQPALMLMCGFTTMPHRTTFGTFFSRLGDHHDLVSECMSQLTEKFRDVHPDLGEHVALDSTPIPSHSSPYKQGTSDPEAGWSVKKKPTGQKGEDEVVWGYKIQTVVDAVHEVPLANFVTRGNRNDNPELRPLLDLTQKAHPWVKPKYVMADRGYDSLANHRNIMRRGGVGIIPMRRKRRGEGNTYDAYYNFWGEPTCVGKAKMEYVKTDPEMGHLYRCPAEGCRLKNRKGTVYCKDEMWVSTKAEDNPRLHGPIRRNSDEWKALYKTRQSVERVFKSAKQSLRLERHCFRGLNKVRLHALMSMLAFTARLLVQTLAGSADVRWMVKRVA